MSHYLPFAPYPAQECNTAPSSGAITRTQSWLLLNPSNDLSSQRSIPRPRRDQRVTHPFSPKLARRQHPERMRHLQFHPVESPYALACVTGSSSHHRFSGPQILRFEKLHPERYAATGRISLVSSFLASRAARCSRTDRHVRRVWG